MAAQRNAAPVLIRRKKVIGGGGHHGGAWKVAYADFVTAMMAFFLLMWLLNATTEKQRKGLADYFNPTIPVNRISGGGDGVFGGESIMAADVLAKTGIGAPSQISMQNAVAQGDGTPSLGELDLAENAVFHQIEEQLAALSGESMVSDRLLRHVVTRLSDEGLVIELFDTEDATLFAEDTAEPRPLLQDLARVVVDVAALAENRIAVSGHVRAYPVTLRSDPSWDLSTARADATRLALVAAGLDPARVQRVTGHADRRPATADPTAIRNNRVEIVLLRRMRE